jgi:hypothetical protein
MHGQQNMKKKKIMTTLLYIPIILKNHKIALLFSLPAQIALIFYRLFPLLSFAIQHMLIESFIGHCKHSPPPQIISI